MEKEKKESEKAISEAEYAKRALDSRKRAKAAAAHLYAECDFMHEKEFKDHRGTYKIMSNKEEYNNHQGKCTHRLCKDVGISHAHLDKAYSLLNGRYIDGFLINDMLDRYGYEGAPNVNRAHLAAKNGKLPRHLEVAFSTLSAILRQEDTIKAFMKYQKEYEDALLKERRDNVVDGE